MSKLMQEAPQSYRGRLFRPDTAKPKEKRILVLQTGLAGMQFHIKNEKERAALASITEGTELLLYREPDNEHDEFAIAVYLTEDDQIGFLSRFKNETIARLMDAGKKFIAIADDPVDYGTGAYRTKKERSRFSPTENMNLPFSIYLVEEE